MASTLGSRLSFENAQKSILKAGKSTQGAVLSQSYLRLETPLAINQTTFKFDILVNENSNGSASFPTVQKLNLQDSFYVSQMGFFLFNPGATATATTSSLLTYPDTTTAGFGANAPQYYNLYNGYMQMTINQRVIMPYWNLNRHLKINQTQQNTTSGLLNQIDGSDDAYFPVEPNLVISGDKKNDLSIVLPNGMTGVTANSRAVIIFLGVLAQNVTSVN